MHARLALALAVLAALLPSCAETKPPLADTWGLSVRMAVENQKLDPSPPSDRAVTGLDGVYTMGALDAYRKSSEPDPQGGKGKDKPVEAMLNKGVQ